MLLVWGLVLERGFKEYLLLTLQVFPLEVVEQQAVELLRVELLQLLLTVLIYQETTLRPKVRHIGLAVYS
jgi:hypothetical protein